MVGVVLAAAACGGGTHVQVRGSLREVGGPSGAADTPISGTVRFTGAGHTFTAAAGGDGSFTLSLPAGTYDVVGTSPQWGDGNGRCLADGPVVVKDTGLTGIVVACPRK